MPAEHMIEDLLDAPLETVLLKLYPAAFLKWLYEASLRAVAREHGNRLPQLEASPHDEKARGPKKAYLIELLIAVLRDKDMSRSFFEKLPVAAQTALAVLSWQGATPLQDLENATGETVADLNPDKRQWYYNPFLLHEGHGFICLLQSRERSWRPFSRFEEKPSKDDYSADLPCELRRALKKVMSPPGDYNLLPLEAIEKASMQYTCEPQAVRDMKLIAEYIQQGHLKYTKAEKISKACIRGIRTITQGPEFFEKSDDGELELLRTRLLVSAMAFAGEEAREHLLRSSEARSVRTLIEKLATNLSFFAEELQSHLTNKRGVWLQFDPKGATRLAAFFAKLPSGKWVTFHNIRRYHTLRDHVPTLFCRPPAGFDVRVTQDEHTWSDRVYIDAANVFDLVSEPLLKGYAFFLAALGMADIAYDLPKQERYCRPRKDYLTPFDGLRGIRLTDLGEFVLGKCGTYDIESESLTPAVVALDTARLLASCADIDPLTELALKQFMDTLAPGRYRMTHQSLLGGCASRKELEQRIQLFRRVISEKPPPIWERFFEKTLSRIAPLQPEPDRVVLKIDSDDDIRRLFASDPILRKHSLRVEGLRIAVCKKDLKTIAKRLEHFGYLCPLSSILPEPFHP